VRPPVAFQSDTVHTGHSGRDHNCIACYFKHLGGGGGLEFYEHSFAGDHKCGRGQDCVHANLDDRVITIEHTLVWMCT
jgi:hypothetical protein